MRIFFIGEGRLGNQIFQYAALAARASPGARLTAIGLEHLEELFELQGPTLRVLRGGRWFRRAAKYLLAPLFRLLARDLRLISYGCDPPRGDAHRGSGGELALRRGLFSALLFVDGGYYQSSEFWGELFPPRWLKLRDTWRERALTHLASVAGGRPRRPVFLHVRRGDYLGYRTYGVDDLSLPADYFRRAVTELHSRGDFDLLAIVTDDPQWARQELGNLPGSVVICDDPRVDFALMASCAGGILSNSTFSLAAALFMRDPQQVIAPRYWLGFRVNQWLPPRIHFEDPRIAYLDVLPKAVA